MSGEAEALHTTYNDKEKFSLHLNNLPMHKAIRDNLVLRKKLKSTKTKGSDVQAHLEKSDCQMRNNINEIFWILRAEFLLSKCIYPNYMHLS